MDKLANQILQKKKIVIEMISLTPSEKKDFRLVHYNNFRFKSQWVCWSQQKMHLPQ